MRPAGSGGGEIGEGQKKPKTTAIRSCHCPCVTAVPSVQLLCSISALREELAGWHLKIVQGTSSPGVEHSLGMGYPNFQINRNLEMYSSIWQLEVL